MTTDGPLALVTLDEIVAELRRRFNAMLLVVENDRSDEEIETLCFWRGSPAHTIGLARYLEERMINERVHNPEGKSLTDGDDSEESD